MQRIGAAGAGAISFNDDEPVETPETTTVRPSPAGGLADDAFDELVTPRAPQTLEEQLLKGGSKSIFSWGQNNTVCDDLRGSDPLAQSSDRISNAQAQGMRQESSLA